MFRPALDSFEALADRILLMPYQIFTKKTTYRTLPFFRSPSSPPKEEEGGEAKDSRRDFAALGQQVDKSCNLSLMAVKNCTVRRSWSTKQQWSW